MESSIAEFLSRKLACELLPTIPESKRFCGLCQGATFKPDAGLPSQNPRRHLTRARPGNIAMVPWGKAAAQRSRNRNERNVLLAGGSLEDRQLSNSRI
jgi:hypothetical protein